MININQLEYKYPLSECQREFELLKTKKGSLELNCQNKIVLTFQPHYYEKENDLWRENKNNLRNRLIENREKYLFKSKDKLNDKELLRGFKISGEHIGFSHFNPLWIKYFIEQYNIKSIYDPCGGWGHRLLGAHDIKYVYNDLDSRSYNGVKNISTFLSLNNKAFYNQDCTKFTPPDSYESIFTCPPYYNTEIYQNKQFKDMNDYKMFWTQLIKCSIKSSVKYFAYVINHEYQDLTQNICNKLGLNLVNIYPIKMKSNHFQRVSKTFNKTESIIVYE